MAKSFSEQLQAWRDRMNMTQEQAAACLHNMPVHTLRRYEQGNRLPAPWVQTYILGHIKQNPHVKQK